MDIFFSFLFEGTSSVVIGILLVMVSFVSIASVRLYKTYEFTFMNHKSFRFSNYKVTPFLKSLFRSIKIRETDILLFTFGITAILLILYYIIILIGFTLFLVEREWMVTKIANEVVVKYGIFTFAFVMIGISIASLVCIYFKTIDLLNTIVENSIDKALIRKYLTYRILANKLKIFIVAYCIYFIALIIEFLLFSKGIISYQVIIFTFLMITALYTKQKLLELRVEEGFYGNAYSEVREIASYLIKIEKNAYESRFDKVFVKKAVVSNQKTIREIYENAKHELEQRASRVRSHAA